jgi:Cu-Zn family superoxide dismutase
VHVNGLIGNQCNDAGAHYNPFNVTHGAPNSTIRHIGDLGNIVEDSNGNVNYTFSDNIISLHGQYNIVNRSIVVIKV